MSTAKQRKYWREARAVYRKRHPDRVKKAKKKWQLKNLHKHRIYNDRFRKKNPSYNKDYHVAHKEEILIQHLEYRTVPKNRMIVLLSAIKCKAKERGLAYNKDDMYNRFVSNPPTYCVCCNKILDYSTGKGRNRSDSPSFDRVDNSKGYEITNVEVICWDCNNKKSDSTIQNLETILKYMRERIEKTI